LVAIECCESQGNQDLAVMLRSGAQLASISSRDIHAGALRLKVPAVLVATKNVQVGHSPFVSFVRVTQGADLADAYIVDGSAPGDFCDTADIPLAALLVDKGLVVIDPRGDLYAAGNVGERLAMRDFMAGLREAGVQTGGPPPFSAKAKQRFAPASIS
jgi:uncharacterized protein YaiI (UPF0178 family)